MFSFFGTDGIRGKTFTDNVEEKDSLDMLVEQRLLHPHVFRLLGEAIGLNLDLFGEHGRLVVIGWDQRPNNPLLAQQLSIGLNMMDCEVIHVPNTSTPALHGLLLHHKATLGCMITASHNPATDSGIKLFNSDGLKCTPDKEAYLSGVMIQLSAEERPIEEEDMNQYSQPTCVITEQESAAFHQQWLSYRLGMWLEQCDGSDVLKISNPLYVDSSGGAAKHWLSSFLSTHGIPSVEVSHDVAALNMNCGAGGLKPGMAWSWNELQDNSHALLSSIQRCEAGFIVGAAIDGDGDRCMLLESTLEGVRIIDGDDMANMLIHAAQQDSWKVACSIESDLEFQQQIIMSHKENECFETAVGDRWLGFALTPFLTTHNHLHILGVEDSGHLVMPSSTDELPESLVGDGVATMIRTLKCGQPVSRDKMGQKLRISLFNAHRVRWSNQTPLFLECHSMVMEWLNQQGFQSSRQHIEGEPHLLLVKFSDDSSYGFIGIRNSGTEEKTNITLRLSHESNPEQFTQLIDEIKRILEPAFL